MTKVAQARPSHLKSPTVFLSTLNHRTSLPRFRLLERLIDPIEGAELVVSPVRNRHCHAINYMQLASPRRKTMTNALKADRHHAALV